MERTDRAAVVPADFGWSDVGSWNAVRDVLELIEVQAGSYLGEDDIVRLNDEYGRN